MRDEERTVVNVDEVEEEVAGEGTAYAQAYKVLTPSMRPRGGSLGVNLTRLAPGCSGGPFHTHQLEDEVFYVLSGTGTLRYGDALIALRAGDCVSCPAGTGVAHQIANTGDEDLCYLAMGRHDANEVCTYPDSAKVYVRSLATVGALEKRGYMDGEPAVPRIFELERR